MIYAAQKVDVDSLEIIKLVLQMIELEETTVPLKLKNMVFDIIDEANILSIDSNSCRGLKHKESISLALEMKEIKELNECISAITSPEKLESNSAKIMLKHLSKYDRIITA